LVVLQQISIEIRYHFLMFDKESSTSSAYELIADYNGQKCSLTIEQINDHNTGLTWKFHLTTDTESYEGTDDFKACLPLGCGDEQMDHIVSLVKRWYVKDRIDTDTVWLCFDCVVFPEEMKIGLWLMERCHCDHDSEIRKAKAEIKHLLKTQMKEIENIEAQHRKEIENLRVETKQLISAQNAETRRKIEAQAREIEKWKASCVVLSEPEVLVSIHTIAPAYGAGGSCHFSICDVSEEERILTALKRDLFNRVINLSGRFSKDKEMQLEMTQTLSEFTRLACELIPCSDVFKDSRFFDIVLEAIGGIVTAVFENDHSTSFSYRRVYNGPITIRYIESRQYSFENGRENWNVVPWIGKRFNFCLFETRR